MEMGSKFEIIGNRIKYILNMARLNGFLKNEKIKNAQKTRKKTHKIKNQMEEDGLYAVNIELNVIDI
jgi:hypothetical protein